MRSLLLIAFMAWLAVHGRACPDDACTQSVICALENAANTLRNTYRARLEVTTILNDPLAARTVEEIHLASDDGNLIIENQHFTLYQDASARVLVLPADSLVCIYNTGGPTTGGMDDWEKSLELIRKAGAPIRCEREATCLEVVYEMEPVPGTRNVGRRSAKRLG